MKSQSNLSIFSAIKENNATNTLADPKNVDVQDQCDPTPSTLEINSPIEQHAAYLFRQIYSIADTNSSVTDGIARYYRGITHVSRAAIYVPVFANLYRKHGNPEIDELAEQDIKLTQIAALLHDSGREAEGKEKDSGILAYLYIKELGVAEEKAKLLAEAVANKDQQGDVYLEIIAEGDKILWNQTCRYSKNIYQKLIHDAVCLDVIRLQDHYKAKYLDFYQEIARQNHQAFDEMAQLILEARSLIETQGDGPCKDSNRKKYYECQEGYRRVLADILNDKNHHTLATMCTPRICPEDLQKISLVDTLPYDPKNGFTDNNIQAAMREGKIFARAISTPSAINSKINNSSNANYPEETYVDVELRKAARRIGTPTRSSKSNNTSKQGNPNRSVSMIGYGTGVYSGAGFLIVNPNIDAITSISKKNAKTGRGKKEYFLPPHLTRDEKEKQLKNLITKLKMGGSSIKYQGFASNHVEITYNLEDYDGIFFSPDPNPSNISLHSAPTPTHPFSPLLQAIYLQKEYEKLHGKKLPIFEYSGLHNSIHRVDEEAYSKKKLKQMWTTLCIDYVKKQSQSITQFIDLICHPIDEIKIKAMYGEKSSYTTPNKFLPADINYAKELREAINQEIYQQAEAILINQLQGDKDVKENIKFIQRFLDTPHQDILLDEKKRAQLQHLMQKLKASLDTSPMKERFIFNNNCSTFFESKEKQERTSDNFAANTLNTKRPSMQKT